MFRSRANLVLGVTEPVAVTRTCQDLSLEMVGKTRRISTLTPSAGFSLVVWGFSPENGKVRILS